MSEKPPSLAAGSLPTAVSLAALGALAWTAAPRMAQEWSTNPNAEHVLLALPVAALFLGARMRVLRVGPQVRPYWLAAAPLLALGLGLLFLDAVLAEPFLLAAGLWCGGLGGAALLGGREGFGRMLFPFLLLAFALPLPQAVARSVLHLHLQRAAASVTGGILALGGLDATATGTLVEIGGRAMTVAEQCSGLKFTATLGFGSLVVGALLLPGRTVARALLAAASLPVAFGVNVGRLCTAAVLLQTSGKDAMNAFLHQGWAVLLLYAVGIGLLIGLATLLGGTDTRVKRIRLDDGEGP